MHTLQHIKLPYISDSSVIFRLLAHEDWPIWLDSGQDFPGHHTDIIAINPVEKLIFDPDSDLNSACPSITLAQTAEESFRLAEKRIDLNRHDEPHGPGWFGYLSYDLFDSFEHIEKRDKPSLLPAIALGYYSYTIVTDHKQKSTTLYFLPEAAPQARETAHKVSTQVQTQAQARPNDLSGFSISKPFTPTTKKQDYDDQFHQVKAYINNGDCYQVNLTQQFSTNCKGNALSAFLTLREQHSSPMSAYFKTPWFEIISMSPERFIKKDGDQLTTLPIKGTRPRSQNHQEDLSLIHELKNSKKDLAENVMIVDLLRNDLGRICINGSVKTEKLFEIESFPNVHHLVSTVTGKIAQPYSLHQLFRAIFPGGSITGAPKVRAMEIIEELEQHRRSIYCGSVVHFSGNGDLDSSIAIRTLLKKEDNLYCWGGGGVVADSNCEKEYQETLDKVGKLMRILESEFGAFD